MFSPGAPGEGTGICFRPPADFRTVLPSIMPNRSRPVVFEPLDGRTLYAASPAMPLAATVAPAAVAIRRVYLTGNSLTDGINYSGFATLLQRDGAKVSLGRQTGSGFSQYANLTLQTGYHTSGVDPARPSDADPWGNYQQAFAAGTWDVLTIQPHDRRVISDPYGEPTPHDEAEVPVGMSWLKVLAKNNAKGQAFVYSRPSRRTDVEEDGVTPTGQSFDYATEWSKTYNEADAHPNFLTQSRTLQIMSRLRKAAAADSTTKGLPPVRLIPVGEAYANVDKMLKAGKFAGTGVTSMLQLYLDQSHPTPDLAAYVIALTFYSSITGNDPRGVTPPSQYLPSGSNLANATVQKLVQQAVYDAITASVYSGFCTPLNGGVTPPPATGSATFRGYVINDKDGDGVWDKGELGVTGRTVWLDLDNDGKLDSNEPKATTAGNGVFEFKNVAAGKVFVREVLPSGVKQTSPKGNAALTATLTNGQTKSGQYFATK